MLTLRGDWKQLWEKSDSVFLAAPASWFHNSWLKKLGLDEQLQKHLQQAISQAKAGPKGHSIQTLTGLKNPQKITVALLPDEVSRGNSPTRRAHLFDHAQSVLSGGKRVLALVGMDKEEHGLAAAAALARRDSLYNQKSSAAKRHIELVCLDKRGKAFPVEAEHQHVGGAVQWACELVDTPPQELTSTSFAAAVKKRFKDHKAVTVKEIVGDRLLKEGLAGLHGVGRAAVEAPRLTTLEYKPRGAKTKIVLVGKGVCYDTGGLSLKISGSMVSMKSDMGGAAAVIGAFESLVKSKVKAHVIVGLGLVENAIGPSAQRPDDIVRMHSGKTVELNNTDAEGRLVLADALSYLCRKHKPDFAIDAATLTGAQLVATGKQVAAIVCNDDKFEKLAVDAGKKTGDLVCSLPFCPEFFMDEFKSEVADMLNSVRDRMNAQSSCAGQFIYAHIDDVPTKWLHIDLAGPAFVQSRATGFGVSLIHQLVQTLA